jgi:hypothetical protein
VLLGVGDALKQFIGLSPIYVKAAAEPGEVGIFTLSGAERHSIVANAEYTPFFHIRIHIQLTYFRLKRSDSPTQVAASALFEVLAYSPLSFASKVTCPFILVSPEEDGWCLLQTAQEAINASGDKGELVAVPGGEYHSSQHTNAV